MQWKNDLLPVDLQLLKLQDLQLPELQDLQLIELHGNKGNGGGQRTLPNQFVHNSYKKISASILPYSAC